MYHDLIAMLFTISVCAVPALWVLDKALGYLMGRYL
jgi:hypothetical protein